MAILSSSAGKAEGGTLVLPMPAGLETGGGLPREGGRHRWTPTLHSISSSIFLLGPLMLSTKHTSKPMCQTCTHTHTHKITSRGKEQRDGDREREKGRRYASCYVTWIANFTCFKMHLKQFLNKTYFQMKEAYIDAYSVNMLLYSLCWIIEQ